MYWLIDESKSFIYQKSPPFTWKIAIVGGVALPYRGRKKWLDNYAWVGKGSDYNSRDENEICQVLDGLIDCKVQLALVIGDVGHSSIDDAEELRRGLITPLYSFANNEPLPRRELLRSYLDNLLGKGTYKISLQDFYKTWCILEVLAMLFKVFLANLHKTQSVDLRNLKIIVDDQPRASLEIFREFTYFFIHCRSNSALFSYPDLAEKHRMSQYLKKEGSSNFFNLLDLIDKITVQEHGAKMDDKHPELKTADLLSNFFRRALSGELSPKILEKLKQIPRISTLLHASPTSEELKVHAPAGASELLDSF